MGFYGEQAERGGYVYFAQAGSPAGDPIKIGWSTNPSCRVREMNCWYPFGDLRVCRTFRGTKRDEKALHEKFAHLRMRGEWFRPEPELCDFINAIGREAAA